MSTALAEVTVSVTQEHIDRGTPCRTNDCPIALALIAAIPGATEAQVYHIGDTDEDYWADVCIDDSSSIRLRLPEEAGGFITAYDAYTGEDDDDDDPYAASPFTFTAEVAA